MADRKIRNISTPSRLISVQVKNDVSGNDVTVQVGPNEEFWCPNDQMTKPLAIYARKKHLELTSEQKPDGAVYYESYPVDAFLQEAAPTIEEEDTEEADEDDVDKSIPVWEDGEVEYLAKNYPLLGLVHCSEHLGRTERSVKRKVQKMKLKRIRGTK